MNDAVTPGRSSVLQVVTDLKNANKKSKLDDRTEALAELTVMPGWKVLKEYLEARQVEVRSMVSGNLEEGLEAIGFRAILADLVVDELKGIVQRVEGSREAVDQDEEEQTSGEPTT